VNREVEAFNSSLQNRLKCFGKVKLVDVINEREFYTRHGQHLNSRGKESMASKLCTNYREYNEEESGSHQYEMV
jgi:hypothetical protein